MEGDPSSIQGKIDTALGNQIVEKEDGMEKLIENLDKKIMLVANNEADLCLRDTFHLDNNGCEFSNSLMGKVTATLDMKLNTTAANSSHQNKIHPRR